MAGVDRGKRPLEASAGVFGADDQSADGVRSRRFVLQNPRGGARQVSAARAVGQFQRLVRESGMYLASTVGQTAVTLLTTPVFTRHLAREEYGMVSTSLALSGLIAPVGLLGQQTALNRVTFDALAGRGQLKDYVKTTIALTLLWETIVLGVLYAVRETVAQLIKIDPDLITAVVIGVLALSVSQLYGAVLRARREVTVFSGLQLLNGVSGGVIGVVLVILGMGIRGRMAGYVAGALIVALPAAIGLFRLSRHGRILRTYAYGTLRFGVPLVAHEIAAWMIASSDRLLMSSLSSLTATAVYSVAYSIGSVAGMVASATNMAWTAHFLQRHTTGEWTSDALAEIMVRLAAAPFATAVILAAVEQPALRWLAPADYQAGWVVIPLVLMGQVAVTLYYFTSTQLLAQRRTKTLAVISVSGAITNLGLNVFLIPRTGYLGAAASTLTAYALMYALGYAAVAQGRLYRWPWRLWALAGATTCSVLGIAVADWIWPVGYVINWGLKLLSLVAFGAVFLVLDRNASKSLRVAWQRLSLAPSRR